jgi:hypothetical protein
MLGIVAASGPSLTPEVAEQCRGHTVIAVNDAYKLFPFARYLYACDASWWKFNKGCPKFAGEKWSSHSAGSDDKSEAAKKFGLSLIDGDRSDGFSLTPGRIHYGNNSGFQAINLFLLWGFNPILLVGFDMRLVDHKGHFFGDHQYPLRRIGSFSRWLKLFEAAAKELPKRYEIINCTPDSALTCFPQMDLGEALQNYASRAA